MAQADQLKSIRLLFFNDDELKELMAIPFLLHRECWHI